MPTDRDVTAMEWLRDIVGASDKVIALAESIYANDFGVVCEGKRVHLRVDPTHHRLELESSTGLFSNNR